MKQTLPSPVKGKKWAGLAALAVVMVLLLRARLSNFAGTLFTIGIIILFIDILVNGVLAEFEYTIMDQVFVYKRKFGNREKILFFVPLEEMVAILPETDEGLQQYEIRGTNNLIPRFCEGDKYVGIYRENEKYFRFLFLPNEELLSKMKSSEPV